MSHNLLITPYPPSQNYSMTFWCPWHLPPNGCSHLLQHLSPGPVASSCVLLVSHSTYIAYGSATSHQQLVSLKIRKSQLSLFPYTDTAHTLFVEKSSSLFSCMFYKRISKCSGIHQREVRETFTLIMLLSKFVTSLRL